MKEEVIKKKSHFEKYKYSYLIILIGIVVVLIIGMLSDTSRINSKTNQPIVDKTTYLQADIPNNSSIIDPLVNHTFAKYIQDFLPFMFLIIPLLMLAKYIFGGFESVYF